MVAVYEGKRVFCCVYRYSFDAFIILVFLTNLLFPVLGGSLLRRAVFHVLRSIDEIKDESYREQQEHQSGISNKSLWWSLIGSGKAGHVVIAKSAKILSLASTVSIESLKTRSVELNQL